MTRVHMDSRKWPDQRHWQFSMERLGEDVHGVWLRTPLGTMAQRGDENPRALDQGFVTLLPPRAWWVAEFYWDHPQHTVYVNIGTPCSWVGDRVSQVDLDLDVVRRLDGTVEILDEDEFLQHQDLYAYPTAIIDSARSAAASAVDQLERRFEPFGDAANRWLEVAGCP